MLERLPHYLRVPVFPGDEDKTFTAGLLHAILWSVLLGYRPTDLLGQRLLEVLHPEEGRIFYHQMIMARGATFLFTLPLRPTASNVEQA